MKINYIKSFTQKINDNFAIEIDKSNHNMFDEISIHIHTEEKTVSTLVKLPDLAAYLEFVRVSYNYDR